MFTPPDKSTAHGSGPLLRLLLLGCASSIKGFFVLSTNKIIFIYDKSMNTKKLLLVRSTAPLPVVRFLYYAVRQSNHTLLLLFLLFLVKNEMILAVLQPYQRAFKKHLPLSSVTLPPPVVAAPTAPRSFNHK